MMISGAQLDALNTRMLEKFSRELALRLESEVPEWMADAPADSRQQRVHAIVEHARQLRITAPEDLCQFTIAVARFGIELPLPPPLAAELRGTGPDRAAQIENLMLRLMSGRDRKQALSL